MNVCVYTCYLWNKMLPSETLDEVVQVEKVNKWTNFFRHQKNQYHGKV